MMQSVNSIAASPALTKHAMKIIPALALAMMWGCTKTEDRPAPPAVQPQAAAPAAAPVAQAPAVPAPQMTAEAPKAMEAMQPKPAAPVAAETKPAAAAPAAPASTGSTAEGEKSYKGACVACHQMGIAGAPKVGDKANWEPRIKQGKDVLYKHTIEGFKGQKGMMPPRGGSALKDDQIKAAVDYMISQSQ